jgi:hypothetical protein
MLMIYTYDHELTGEIDFWFNDVVEGYALGFSLECHQSLTKALDFFNKGPCGRFIIKILVWIKMLLVEQAILPNPIEMGA